MAKVSIPEGKKRYTITLTEETMTRMHDYMKSKNAPKNMLSGLIDEFLTDVMQTIDELEAAQQRKGDSVGLGQLLQTVGGVISRREDKQGRLL